MSNDIEFGLINQTNELRAAESSGALALKEQDQAVARTKQETSDAEAEKAWRTSGIGAPYDYKKAYGEGKVDFAKGELPNRYIEPLKVEVAGGDLVSPKQYREVAVDPYLLVTPSRAELRASTMRVKGEPPALDVNSLGKIGYAFAFDGKTYEDFSKNVPQNWTEYQKKKAWASATNALRNNDLTTALQLEPPRQVSVKPADMSYEQTMATPEFSSAARQIYKSYEGEEFSGDDIAASRWLGNHFRDFEFNTVLLTNIMRRAASADGPTLNAYKAGFDLWDRTEMEKSVPAQVDNVIRMLLDPVNLAGFGIGKVSIMSASRVAFKELLRRVTIGGGLGMSVGATQEIGKATLSGESPTVEGVAGAVVGGAVGGAVVTAALPELAAAGLKLARRAAANYAKAPPAPMAGTPRSQIGAVNPGGPVIPPGKKPAFDPVNGFYSPAARAAAAITRPKLAISEVEPLLRKGPDVSQAELDHLDLPGAFEGRKSVTPAEILAYIESKPMPVEVNWATSKYAATNPLSAGEREKLAIERSPQYVLAAKEFGETALELKEVNRVTDALLELQTQTTAADPGLMDELDRRIKVMDDVLLPLQRQAEEKGAYLTHLENFSILDHEGKGLGWEDRLMRERDPTYAATFDGYLEDLRLNGETFWAARNARRLVDSLGRLDPRYGAAMRELKAAQDAAETTESKVLSNIATRLQKTYDLIDRQSKELAESLKWSDYTAGHFGLKPESNYRVMFMSNTTKDFPTSIKHFPIRGLISWVRTTDRRAVDGGLGLFIEESQSDTHSLFRRGNKRWDMAIAGTDETRSYEQAIWDEYLQFNEKQGDDSFVDLPQRWEDVVPADRAAMSETSFFLEMPTFLEMPVIYINDLNGERVAIPAAAEEIMTRTHVTNMFRGILYKAAMEGKDFVAWSPAEKLIERFAAQGVAARSKGIKLFDDGEIVFLSSAKNNSAEYLRLKVFNMELTRAQALKKLEDMGMKEAANAVRNWKKGQGTQVFDFDKNAPTVPEGFQFYDKEYVNEMNKYLKRYGAKVETKDFENGAEKSWSIDIRKIREQIIEGGIPLISKVTEEQSSALA